MPFTRNGPSAQQQYRVTQRHSAEEQAEFCHAACLLVDATAACLPAAALTAAVVVCLAEGVAEVQHTTLCAQRALVRKQGAKRVCMLELLNTRGNCAAHLGTELLGEPLV